MANAKFIRPCDTSRTTDNFAAHKARGSGLPGLDFACATGSKIYASADGVVTRANFMGASGKNIRIAHPDGTTTYYLHLSSLWVRNGQHVAQGNVIGLSGNTGSSTGPHLHFSVANKQGVLIDPASVIGKEEPVSVPSRRTVSLGKIGADVKYLQVRLGIRPADGVFGPITRRAVIAFQKRRGLAADGVVGPKTWAAID